MGNSFGGKDDQKWFETEFLEPMGCAGPGSCFAETTGITYKVLMVGLDGAGKTQLCLRLMDRGNEVPVKTGMETAIYDNKMARERTNNWQLPLSKGLGDDVTLAICDVGGHKVYRRLWSYKFQDVTAVLFVVDACDEARITEARNTLFEYVLPQVESGQLPLVVIANDKEDMMQRPLTEEELLRGLGLEQYYLGPASPPQSRDTPPPPADEADDAGESLAAAAVAAAVATLWAGNASLPDVEVRRMAIIASQAHKLLPPKERFHFTRVRSGDAGEPALRATIVEVRARIEQNIDRLMTKEMQQELRRGGQPAAAGS